MSWDQPSIHYVKCWICGEEYECNHGVRIIGNCVDTIDYRYCPVCIKDKEEEASQ